MPVVVVGVEEEEYILLLSLASSSHSGRCRRMDLLEGIAIIRRRRVRDDMLCEERRASWVGLGVDRRVKLFLVTQNPSL